MAARVGCAKPRWGSGEEFPEVSRACLHGGEEMFPARQGVADAIGDADAMVARGQGCLQDGEQAAPAGETRREAAEGAEEASPDVDGGSKFAADRVQQCSDLVKLGLCDV